MLVRTTQILGNLNKGVLHGVRPEDVSKALRKTGKCHDLPEKLLAN
jgi:hypothetical protein